MDGSDPSCILFLKGRYSYIVVLVFYQDGIGHVSHVVQAVMSYLFLVFRRLTWTDYLFYSSKKIQCFSIQIIFKHEQITVNILTLNNLNLSSPKIVFFWDRRRKEHPRNKLQVSTTTTKSGTRNMKFSKFSRDFFLLFTPPPLRLPFSFTTVLSIYQILVYIYK